MIDSISSSNTSYGISSTSLKDSNSLSFTQQQVLEDVLSNYDSDNLSTFDAQEIVSAFKDAQIKPSKSLADAMQSLGFDAQDVASLAGINKPHSQGAMPPPPPPPKEDENSISDIISELLYSNEEDEESTSSVFNTYSSSNNELSFESVLDYTSRIMNLNEGAKDKVFELFEKYDSSNTQLSSKEVNNVVKNSLKDILGNEENYKQNSFYA